MKIFKELRKETGIEVGIGLNDSGAGYTLNANTEEDDDLYNAALDGIDTLLLALAQQGFDLDDSRIIKSVNAALESCAQNI